MFPMLSQDRRNDRATLPSAALPRDPLVCCARLLAALLVGGMSVGACQPTDSNSDDDDGSSAIEAFCQTLAACEGGNVADARACVVTTEVSESYGVVTGCDALFETYLTCANDNNLCAENQLSFDCGNEQAAFDACITTVTTPVGSEPSASAAAKAWCADTTACNELSELEVWACQLQFDGYLDTARAYGCNNEAAAFAACAPNDNSCVEGALVLGGSCDVTLSGMLACNMAASNL